MTLWELMAAVAGWNRVHGAEQSPPPPTDDEFEAMQRLHGDLKGHSQWPLH